jgi:hypothetical protein
MIETDLYSYLSTCIALIALVSTRIYPVQAPKEVATPYLVYFKVSPNRKYTHQGFANFQQPRIQISCYATRYITSGSEIGAKSLSQILISALEAWPGAERIQAVQVEDEKDLIDPDTNLYHVAVDFFVSYGA